MTNIYKELVTEASQPYTWLDKISQEGTEFLNQLSVHIKQGNKANATKLQEILEREFNLKVSHSTVNRWINTQYKESTIHE